jgi:transposase
MTKGECWKMYHEVKDLSTAGLGVTQIQNRVNMSRNTIYRYLNMTEEQFVEFLFNKKFRKKKLLDKEMFISNLLKEYPDIMATQVESMIKETYGELPVHPKTVNNFVNELRIKYQIPKEVDSRIYQAVEELPYGQQAQVDFGQKVMFVDGKNTKVYFFAMSLSRTRYKYVYFQKEPFTSQTAICCFERGFCYYGGFPKEIVFDQDRVFMVSENYGDLILTDEFGRYAGGRPFKLSPCRSYDPESKGRIENVVKYIKYNFMSCRKALSLEDLNRQGLIWLDLTGNGKIHQTTKKVPKEEFEIEKVYLIPHNKIDIPKQSAAIYDLRKDNTVAYESNRYRVPAGTYKNKFSTVILNKNNDILVIFNSKNEEIAKHTVPSTKGNLIGDKSHTRDNSKKISELITEISETFDNDITVKEYLIKLKEAKGKYIRDQLLLLKELTEIYGTIYTKECIKYCMTKLIISVPDLKSVILKKVVRIENIEEIQIDILCEINKYNDLKASTRSISEYQEVCNG